MTARSVQIATRAELLSREDFIEYVDSVFAEIKAEALREAADRADAYMTSHAADSGFWDVNTLCKIILSDKQEPPHANS